MTLQQAAQTALDCQDACNLSGVLNSFATIVHDVIWPEARRLERGTAFVNEHPIVVLFLDKLSSLARCQHLGAPRVMEAFAACEKLAKGEDIEWLPAERSIRVAVGKDQAA